jgi:hypothetical protein
MPANPTQPDPNAPYGPLSGPGQPLGPIQPNPTPAEVPQDEPLEGDEGKE